MKSPDNVLTSQFGLSLDLTPLMEEAQKKLRQHAQHEIDCKIKVLFHDPKNQAEMAYGLRNGASKDPDLSYCFKKIDEQITELVCGDKYDAWIKKYVEENYEQHLKNALDRSMAAHANKHAFTKAKEAMPS
ncbi:hypothetical protein [Aeromonas veronii]|nr:hypothetical protein [Aeromonas veronii]